MAKINGNEIRPGNVIEHQGTIWRAVKTEHVKPGKGGAFAQVELKNLIDGRKLNERFRAAETVEKIRLEQKDFNYLFENGDMLVFMDQETFEQIELPREFMGEMADYLQDGTAVQMEFYEEKPIGCEIPEQVILKVTDTEPVVKGQTAANSYKPAVLENGVRTAVPPFVGVGEKIIVSTADGSYVRRAD